MGASSKIKVVYLIGELGKGGSERQLYLLVKHLDKQVIEPHIIVFNRSPNTVYTDELVEFGVHVNEIPKCVKGILRRILFLCKVVKSIKPQIIHSWSVHDNPYAGLVGFLTGVPVRLGSMRDSLKNQNFVALPKMIQYLSLWAVSSLFVNSRSIKKELVEINYPSQRIQILDNCVELVDYKDTLLVNEIIPDFSTDNFRLIGTVANIRRKKNIHIFIEGLSYIIKDYADVFGLIVGQSFTAEKQYYEEIKEQITNLGLENNVFLLGFFDNVPELMHHLSVFCLLSSYEGTPNVVLEAMAAARPVIATSVGGIPEIIQNGINGLLVEPENVGSFVEALKKLLSDSHLAVNLGQAGRQFVEEKFSPIVRSAQLVEIYQGLLRGHNGY